MKAEPVDGVQPSVIAAGPGAWLPRQKADTSGDDRHVWGLAVDGEEIAASDGWAELARSNECR